MLGPWNLSTLSRLVSRQTDAVTEQQLYAVGPLGAEYIDNAGLRLPLQFVLDDGRKPIHPLPEVDRLGCHEHPDARRRHNQASTFNAFNTSASVLASAAPAAGLPGPEAPCAERTGAPRERQSPNR